MPCRCGRPRASRRPSGWTSACDFNEQNAGSRQFQVPDGLPPPGPLAAAGAFALSENNLYTTDAFREYLAHLTDDGILAITRWGFEPPRESLRLISLAIDALAPSPVDSRIVVP